MDAAVPVGSGRVTRLGGSIPLDGRVSWYPSGWRGFSPSNSYLLTEGDAGLLVDPGLAVNVDSLLQQLRAQLAAHARLSILLTRGAEFDCLTAAADVLAGFPVERVIANSRAELFIGFSPQFPFPDAGEESWVDPTIEWVQMSAGEIAIDTSGHQGHALELVPTPLRLLPTFWLYDPLSATLFTSDAFGHAVCRTESGAAVIAEGDEDTTTLADVRDYMRAKLDWLARASTGAIRDGIADIFASRRVEAVAPAHGRMLVGGSVVMRHLELVLAALGEEP